MLLMPAIKPLTPFTCLLAPVLLCRQNAIKNFKYYINLFPTIQYIANHHLKMLVKIGLKTNSSQMVLLNTFELKKSFIQTLIKSVKPCMFQILFHSYNFTNKQTIFHTFIAFKVGKYYFNKCLKIPPLTY